ncbi:flavodoxin family protein [Wukongibacter baidiensis]|uniref:flavodoxin family protein n=1 Tax=Wukongibacter baidiensis TaxID=1723361 RepID=UPI003D7FDF8B
MKIVAYNGSPKGKDSVTHKMIEEVLKGAKEEGAEVVNYTLAEKNLSHCRGCFHCWNVERNKCVIKDDMKEALSHFLDLDILLLGTPLQFDNVSGIMKMFLDRCISFGSYPDEKQSDTHVGIPKIIILSNSGDSKQSRFQALDFMIETMAENMGTEVIAKIFRSQGPLLSFYDEGLRPVVDNYMLLLRQAGREIVRKLKIDEKTQEQLEKPLVPPNTNEPAK